MLFQLLLNKSARFCILLGKSNKTQAFYQHLYKRSKCRVRTRIHLLIEILGFRNEFMYEFSVFVFMRACVTFMFFKIAPRGFMETNDRINGNIIFKTL